MPAKTAVSEVGGDSATERSSGSDPSELHAAIPAESNARRHGSLRWDQGFVFMNGILPDQHGPCKGGL